MLCCVAVFVRLSFSLQSFCVHNERSSLFGSFCENALGSGSWIGLKKNKTVLSVLLLLFFLFTPLFLECASVARSLYVMRTLPQSTPRANGLCSRSLSRVPCASSRRAQKKRATVFQYRFYYSMASHLNFLIFAPKTDSPRGRSTDA